MTEFVAIFRTHSDIEAQIVRGLLTTDEAIGEDVAHLFNNLSGYSRNASYAQLMVAPDSARSRSSG